MLSIVILRLFVPAICCLFPGRVGSREDGTQEPDFQQQVRLAFDEFACDPGSCGMHFDDIIDVTSFHTDPENQFEDIMTVKNEIFSAPPYPNWTAVGLHGWQALILKLK